MHWLQHRWHAEQWLVEKNHITQAKCYGWRRRVLLSRSLCLFYALDLNHIPTTRRQAALAQQLKLLSPFAEPGFYAQWQAGKVCLWLWDQAALLVRLPEAGHALVLPDSALAPAHDPTESTEHSTDGISIKDGHYHVRGISGLEQQQWQQGLLQDSRWQPDRSQTHHAGEPCQIINLALDTPAPLQAADQRLLGHICLGALASGLLMILLLQAGGAVSLWQQYASLEQSVQLQNEQNQLQLQAMRRALSARERWLARESLLQQVGQLGYVQQLAKALPISASFWQHYSYQPGRLQLLLTDPEPDPRDYVRIIGSLPNTHNVQVQLDPANQKVTVQAELSANNAAPQASSSAVVGESL